MSLCWNMNANVFPLAAITNNSLDLAVPFMAQRLTNLTRIHEDKGLIPGLAQWLKDLVLP